MKVPLSWLRDYVDITLPPQALAERLTLAGLEVEAITYVGEMWDRDKVFVAQVRQVSRHPDAERLVLASVDYGAGEPLTVVTGAPNLYGYVDQDLDGGRGPKVAFAIAGATLVDGHQEGRHLAKLKPGKIRGIRSEGMVLSEKELDLSDEHEGILMLPADAPVGAPLVDYLGDAILEFDIKGAFGHLQSVVGIAREVAALTGQEMRRDVLTVFDRTPVTVTPDAEYATIIIDAPDLCLRYSAALIEGLQVGPSPFWMQQRLLRAGMRPINNVVDITNYVMLELGQPLHAFDYDLLVARNQGTPSITMRRAYEGEHMVTLDGVDRALDPQMLLITDKAGAIAVAGVMGGAATEVNEGTRRVLLEAANFSFLSVRRTAQLLKLNSEAAGRFGKQVDPELTVPALGRAGELLAAHAGGTLVPVVGDVYPGRKPAATIELDPHYAGRILGIDVPVPEMARILNALDYQVQVGSGESPLLRVTVPSHRQDVTIPADLVEDIGRIYGYDRLPVTLLGDELPPQRDNLALEGEERVRDLLVGSGLDEIITYSAFNLADATRLSAAGVAANPDDYVRVLNPLTSERAHLRRSLLPGIVNTARANLRFTDRVALFELGHVFIPQPDQPLPDQPRRLAALLLGPREPRTWEPYNASPMDFFDLKGIVEALGTRLSLAELTWERGEHPAMHPGRTARLLVGGQDAGAVGELHPLVRAAFDLPSVPVAVMELDVEVLMAGWGTPHPMREISAQPAVYEDLALIVDETVPAGQVTELVRQTGGKTLTGLQLFDVYRGQPIPAGKKSLAYALTYQAPDRTLTDEDVRKLRHKIVSRLERELGAELRG